MQLDIRTGHAQTVEKVLGWLKEEKLTDVTVCDVRSPPPGRSHAPHSRARRPAAARVAWPSR